MAASLSDSVAVSSKSKDPTPTAASSLHNSSPSASPLPGERDASSSPMRSVGKNYTLHDHEEIAVHSVSEPSRSLSTALRGRDDHSYDWHPDNGTPRCQLNSTAADLTAALSARSSSPLVRRSSGDEKIPASNDASSVRVKVGTTGTYPSVALVSHRPQSRAYQAGTSHEKTVAQDSTYGDNSREYRSDPRNERTAGDDGDTNEQNEESGDDWEEQGGGTQRNRSVSRVRHNQDRPLSCPYRKRNKARFNHRTYEKCSRQFRNPSEVKIHVREFHKRENTSDHDCPRCRRPFATRADLVQHLSTPSPTCQTTNQSHQERLVEDGITVDMNNRLMERKHTTKIGNWMDMWKLLFPDDTDIPSPDYEPCVEAYEFLVAWDAESTTRHMIERSREQVAEMLRKSGTQYPDAVASDIAMLIYTNFRKSQTDCERRLVQQALQNTLSGSATTASSRRRRSTKASRRQESDMDSMQQAEQGWRPPQSSPVPILPRPSANHASPNPVLSPYPAPPTQFQQLTTSWNNDGPVRPVLHSFPASMQQDLSVEATGYTVTGPQPGGNNAYNTEQTPAFPVGSVRHIPPRAQEVPPSAYSAEDDEHYRRSQESWGDWQHMSGSETNRPREN